MIRIMRCDDPQKLDLILDRSGEVPDGIDEAVAEIIADVRKNGDEAALRYTSKFDGANLEALEVTQQEKNEALVKVNPDFLHILEEAAENIRAYHSKQKRSGFLMAEQPGIVLGQKTTALDSVGVYVPGGTAAYPSTVLMDVIPAKLAGVGEIIMVTPRSKDGSIACDILAAAHVAGVDRIFKIGGAQAVAALAYGTRSVPRVDKIVGPGNIYVATAKRMVYGQVDIDMIAGPSEILVIADETANPVHLAADLLSQAEHDKLAASFLVTTDESLANKVAQEVERQLALLPREEIARASIDNNGAIIVTSTIENAVDISNQIAPEHLEVCTTEPFLLLPLIRHAGSIFLGMNTPEALGDYFAGPNHTLPTSGTARFASGLSVDDFIKKSSIIYYERNALLEKADRIANFARHEGLEAHARSVLVRKEGALDE